MLRFLYNLSCFGITENERKNFPRNSIFLRKRIPYTTKEAYVPEPVCLSSIFFDCLSRGV